MVSVDQSPDNEKPFQLFAGNAALDLVNTVDYRFSEGEAKELLNGYDDLLRFVVQSGIVNPEQARKLKRASRDASAAARLLRQVKELREALAGAVYALVERCEVPARDLAVLERYFKQMGEHRVLSVAGDGLAWSWRDDADVSAPLWLLAGEAAELLLSERAGLIRTCASDTCRWLFLDTSKNHTRRWCDMKICGNRMKARRFHARQSR